MIEVARAIKSFLPAEQQVDFVPPDDPILEIPFSEFQDFLEEMVLTHNQMGRELARLEEDHARAIKAGNHIALKEAFL